MPATTTPVRTEASDLEVSAACPECGGANAWRLLQSLRRCEYCGSALWWPADPGRPGFLAAEDAAGSPAALLDVLQTLDALRERSRIASQRRAGSGPPDGPVMDMADDPTLPGLNELKAERRHLFELEADHEVLAPYLLASVTVVFHALGRSREVGRKEYRNLFFVAEEILPAYPAPWDFRDRGLWVARQRFRQLSPEDLASGPMKMRDVEVDLDRLTHRFRTQRLLIEPDLEPIAFESGLAAPRLWWVYRPFHYVRARTPMGDRWFLVDGQFGTVAGYPEDGEARRAAARAWTPLDAREVRSAAPRAIGFRCPECGRDVTLGERGELQLCSNCGKLLEPGPDGLKPRTYAVVDRAALPWWPRGQSADVVWLPFFEVRLSVARGREPLADLAALLREALPAAGPLAPALPAEFPSCFIPAFDVLTVGRYDAWAFEWAEALTRVRPRSWERRLFVEEPVAKSNRVLLPAVSWDALRPLLPRLVLELLPKPVQTRLNPVVLKRLLAASIAASRVRLVFVPAPVTTVADRRVLGPVTSVSWEPLRDAIWPPDLLRDVRRALDRGRRLEEKATGETGLPVALDRTARFCF